MQVPGKPHEKKLIAWSSDPIANRPKTGIVSELESKSSSAVIGDLRFCGPVITVEDLRKTVEKKGYSISKPPALPMSVSSPSTSSLTCASTSLFIHPLPSPMKSIVPVVPPLLYALMDKQRGWQAPHTPIKQGVYDGLAPHCVIETMSCALQNYYERLLQVPIDPPKLEPFCLLFDTFCGLAMESYVYDLSTTMHCSSETVVLALVQLEKVSQHVNMYNIHGLLFISLILSSKVHEERTFKNSDWAILVGLETKVVNVMERVFYKLINYNLDISSQSFHLTYNHFMKSDWHQRCNKFCKWKWWDLRSPHTPLACNAF